MNTEESISEQRRMRTAFDDLSKVVAEDDKFVETAYQVILVMQNVFVHFCPDNATVARQSFRNQMDNVISGRNEVQACGRAIRSYVLSSQEVPGPMTRLEVQIASDLTLKGLLIRAEKDANKMAENVEETRLALIAATDLMQRYLK